MDYVVEPVVQYLRDQSSLSGGMKLLQRVHMSMFSGFEMEMEFVRLILASAPILENISIWNYSYLLLRSSREMMDEMKQFHQASPNIEFIFDEVEVETAN
ncbi:hypothetical protein HAX54_041869 [Datura stramonium]|uniref:FBD domain-containing protein n=1 Tax=Datura stramonium TaxID=4076 RepID=A0ABS8SMS1_DATST|nr:hypothetical protein [Datura stramonium]